MSGERGDVLTVVAELRECAASWEPDVRVMGNVRAADVVRVCDAVAVFAQSFNRSEAEAARLSAELTDERAKTVTEWFDRAKMAEAEVARLKAAIGAFGILLERLDGNATVDDVSRGIQAMATRAYNAEAEVARLRGELDAERAGCRKDSAERAREVGMLRESLDAARSEVESLRSAVLPPHTDAQCACLTCRVSNLMDERDAARSEAEVLRATLGRHMCSRCCCVVATLDGAPCPVCAARLNELAIANRDRDAARAALAEEGRKYAALYTEQRVAFAKATTEAVRTVRRETVEECARRLEAIDAEQTLTTHDAAGLGLSYGDGYEDGKGDGIQACRDAMSALLGAETKPARDFVDGNPPKVERRNAERGAEVVDTRCPERWGGPNGSRCKKGVGHDGGHSWEGR